MVSVFSLVGYIIEVWMSFCSAGLSTKNLLNYLERLE